MTNSYIKIHLASTLFYKKNLEKTLNIKDEVIIISIAHGNDILILHDAFQKEITFIFLTRIEY